MENRTNSSLLIFSRQKSSRLSYVLDVLFGHILQVPYQETTEADFFRSWEGPKINYSEQPLTENEIWLLPSGLLFSSQIIKIPIEVRRCKGRPAAFFHTPECRADLPFDLLAFCFYLLSRYEEYTASEIDFDSHGRFMATSSLAYQHQFLDQPVINQWALFLKNKILEDCPGGDFPALSFQFIPTFDIDLAWAYRERPWWRMLAGSLRDLLQGKTRALRHRLLVFTQKEPDPFDTYDYLASLHETFGWEPVFFFLLADPARYDRNIHHQNTRLGQLIKALNAKHSTGIHPSYQSHTDSAKLKMEINRLSSITEQSVENSRFHFLKFRLPTAYRRLIQEGISHDHSMGYASQVGFRAGIATPFPWYDLEKEAATSLLVHPFAVMDATLKNYLQLSPAEGLELVKKLIDHTTSVKGTFVTLWHNSSFSYIEGWEKWKEVYEEILTYCHKHTK